MIGAYFNGWACFQHSNSACPKRFKIIRKANMSSTLVLDAMRLEAARKSVEY